MRVEGVVLEDHRHVPVAGGEVVDDLAVEADRPRRDLLQAGDHPQHGRLAAARRSDEDDELSFVDEQVEPADSLDAVRKDLRQLLERQRRQAAPCQSDLGSQTRIPPSSRFAHAKYGTASSRAGVAAPSRGSSRTSTYSICPHPARSRTAPATDTPGTPPSGASGPLSAGAGSDWSATSARSAPAGKIARLEAVDERAALERQAAANGVDTRMRRGQPGRDVELQRRRGRPGASAAQLRDIAGGDRLAVDERAPRAHAGTRSESVHSRVAARDHLDLHGPTTDSRSRPPARRGRVLDDGADRRGRVLVELHAAVAGRGEVVVERGQQAHDVRRAAGDTGTSGGAALAASSRTAAG